MNVKMIAGVAIGGLLGYHLSGKVSSAQYAPWIGAVVGAGAGYWISGKV